MAANLCVAALQLWHAPHASESSVNTGDRRSFPEYVALGPRPPKVVLISNSQGAYDGADAHLLYPSLLQAAGVQLENWSADGMRSVEIELLTRQAIARGAKVILIVLGFENIDPLERATVDYGHTDIDLLLGEPALWGSLDGGLTAFHLNRDQFASRLLQRYVPLVRARTAFLDNLASRLPAGLQHPLFGQPIEAPIRGPKILALAGKLHNRDTSAMADPPVDDATFGPRLETLRLLTTSLEGEAARVGVKVFWCWQPVAMGRLPPHLRAEGSRFYALTLPLLRFHGFEAYDLAARLPDSDFVDSTHFTANGHRSMRDLLMSTVGDALR